MIPGAAAAWVCVVVRKTGSMELVVGEGRGEAVDEAGVVRGIGMAASEVCSSNAMVQAERNNVLIFVGLCFLVISGGLECRFLKQRKSRNAALC